MMYDFRNMLCDESGATLVEYVVIIAFVGILAVAALQNFTKSMTPTLSSAASQMQ